MTMQLNGNGLREQRTIVRYQAQHDALESIRRVFTDARGVALLHGPKASGKSVVAGQFVRAAESQCAIAVVDGARKNTAELLTGILEQFGFEVGPSSNDEMINMIIVYIVQQAQTHEAPVLIVENINDMFPNALGAICKLASITTDECYALRLVLTSRENTNRIVSSPGMVAIAHRVIGDFRLAPMMCSEAARYLYAKLRSGGVDRPDDVFSVEVCEKLHELSGGWPGEIEEMAFAMMQMAEKFPISVADIIDPKAPTVSDAPKLIITIAGESLREVVLTEKRALIGRSDLSDIVVPDQFVSNQHALLIRDDNAVVLVDLKSRNGTFVNSRRIASKVLLQDDIVSIGDHRMKMVYPPGNSSIESDGLELKVTTKMMNIADARKARESKGPTLTVVSRKKD